MFSFFTSSQREPSSGITKTEAWTPMKLNTRCVCVRDQKQASSVQTSSLSPACLTRSFAFPQGKKAELKRFIIELSKEFSILSQFTSFVAIEERVCQTFQCSYFCSGQPTRSPTYFTPWTESFVASSQTTLIYLVLGFRTNRGLHRHPRVDRRGRCGLPPLCQLDLSSTL